MLSIRKNDTVILPNSAIAKVLDIIVTEAVKVYKIEKLVDHQVIYMEEKLVKLNRQCRMNWLITFAKEVKYFFIYTLGGPLNFQNRSTQKRF